MLGIDKTRRDNPHRKAALGIVAMVAAQRTDTFMSAMYRRVTSRQGRTKPLVAIEHAILNAVKPSVAG